MSILLVMDSRLREAPAETWQPMLQEQAFIEAVRILPGWLDPSQPVLVPWTPISAPLIAAAAIDLMPAFDPEDRQAGDRARGSYLPYLTEGSDPDDEVARSFLPLVPFRIDEERRDEPQRMQALREILPRHRPRVAITLGIDPYALDALGAVEPRFPVVTFSSLVGLAPLRRALPPALDRLFDAEAVLDRIGRPPAEAPDRDRRFDDEAERALEPFIPYGLLLQMALSELLGPPFDGQPTPEAAR